MKRTVISAAVLALAISGMGVGSAGGPVDKVTGGGQVLIGQKAGNGQGAGDTITFQAQDREGSTDLGNVTYIDREGGTGKGQTVLHGDVTCLIVDGNTAKLAGTFREAGAGNFELIVIDNGEGASAEGEDIVTIQRETDVTCDTEDDDDDSPVGLARGNAQVHDAP